MNGKALYLSVGVLIGALAADMGPRGLSGLIRGGSTDASDAYRHFHLFGLAFDAVRTKYVDEPDETKLIEIAIKGMLASLDPHSGFVDGRGLRDMQAITRGEVGEVGIEIGAKEGGIVVVRTVEGTSAAKAGLLPGDIIASIGEASAFGIDLDQALEKLRGEVNSSIRLTVLRGAGREAKALTLVRDVVAVQSVRSYVESGDIGYLRITQFTQATIDSLNRAMARFRTDIPADKFKGYILDLRGNPGGYVDQAVGVVNAFVDAGEIVETRGRRPDYNQHMMARPDGDLSAGAPVVVLIDGATASAAEIVAGALQDLKRATLVGMRSFGKGTMQTTIAFGEDGALRLTTARFYLPSGRSIQARGIEPDFEVRQDIPEDQKEKYETKGEASIKRHLENPEGEKSGSQFYIPSDPSQDKQLIAAVAILHGDKPAVATPSLSGAARAPGSPNP